MNWLDMCVVALISTALAFNVSSFVVLVTSKKLRKSQFKRLVLNLSISDIGTIMEIILHAAVTRLDGQTKTYEYFCVVLRHTISAIIMFSICQILLICIERLNATFVEKNKLLEMLTSTTCVATSFVAVHGVAAIPLVVTLSSGPKSCKSEIPGKLFVLVMDIPMVFLFTSIVAVYCIVIVRIIKQHTVIHHNPTAPTGTPDDSNAIHRMRRNVRTLGFIIVITLVSTLPRSVMAFYSIYTGLDETTAYLLRLCNWFLLLNPLLDPVIYVFRIKEYRESFKVAIRKLFRIQPNTVAPFN